MRTQPPHRAPADRLRVNVLDPWEELYWGEKLACTTEQLRAAVDAVGVQVSDIRVWLANSKPSPLR